MKKKTQCQHVLDILRDGRWHTSAELEMERRMRLNSRISELRARGHAIEHKRLHGVEQESAAHCYRLASLAQPESADAGPPAGVRLSPGSGCASDEGPRPERSLADVVFLLERDGFKELTEAELDECEYEQTELFEDVA